MCKDWEEVIVLLFGACPSQGLERSSHLQTNLLVPDPPYAHGAVVHPCPVAAGTTTHLRSSYRPSLAGETADRLETWTPIQLTGTGVL